MTFTKILTIVSFASLSLSGFQLSHRLDHLFQHGLRVDLRSHALTGIVTSKSGTYCFQSPLHQVASSIQFRIKAERIADLAHLC